MRAQARPFNSAVMATVLVDMVQLLPYGRSPSPAPPPIRSTDWGRGSRGVDRVPFARALAGLLVPNHLVPPAPDLPPHRLSHRAWRDIGWGGPGRGPAAAPLRV